MATGSVHPARVQVLRDGTPRRGRYVLYWMQQSQRARWNDALELAVTEANEAGLPVVVGFGLTDAYPEANLRHHAFLLEGLRDTASALRRRGISFVLRRGAPEEVALDLAREAALVVCDRGYLRHQVAWRRRVAADAGCPVLQVEADAVVPVDHVSARAEFAARTLRPRVNAHAPEFLVPLQETPVRTPAPDMELRGEDPADPESLLEKLKLDRSVPPVSHFFRGGPEEARRRLGAFASAIRGYGANRSQPEAGAVSHLSPYLHLGQISPVEVALAVREAAAPAEDGAAFLEELIVRRGLAQNWVRFTPAYDRYESLPAWARTTLEKHAADPREHVYSDAELETGQTHDPYWNAAMREMRYTGFMHNAMRMYWGKKILEWSETPEEGFYRTLRINNRYFLDGRDPSSYANLGWIYGLHDRPWGERAVFGTVRCMTAGGLERKCDIQAYVHRAERLVADARAAGIRFPDEGPDPGASAQGRLDL